MLVNRRGGRNSNRTSSGRERIRDKARHVHRFTRREVTDNSAYNHAEVCMDCGHVGDRFNLEV